jgi:hypothetical protein
MFAMVVVFIALIWVGALFRFRSLPIERRTYRWRFFPSHIDTASTLSTARLEWPIFVAVKETATLFLFFPQRSICHIIPKRCFSQSADIDHVRKLCREHLGSKASVREAAAG